MKVYIDTGVLLDSLATNEHFSALDQEERRGRSIAQLKEDAEKCLLAIAQQHNGFTSCLTPYEIEGLLFRKLSKIDSSVKVSRKSRTLMARVGVVHVILSVRRFGIDMVGLTDQIVQSRLRNIALMDMESADALHATTAMVHGAEMIVSSDKNFRKLDGTLNNINGVPIRCVDTDTALTLL